MTVPSPSSFCKVEMAKRSQKTNDERKLERQNECLAQARVQRSFLLDSLPVQTSASQLPDEEICSPYCVRFNLSLYAVAKLPSTRIAIVPLSSSAFHMALRVLTGQV